MTVTQTSIEAFHKHQQSIQHQDAAVLNYVKKAGDDGTCIADIWQAIVDDGWFLDKGLVSRSLNNLKKQGRVAFVSKRPSVSTGEPGNHYRLATADEQSRPKPQQAAIPSELSKAARLLVSAKKPKINNQPLLFKVR